jgi:hypothetical protein
VLATISSGAEPALPGALREPLLGVQETHLLEGGDSFLGVRQEFGPSVDRRQSLAGAPALGEDADIASDGERQKVRVSPGEPLDLGIGEEAGIEVGVREPIVSAHDAAAFRHRSQYEAESAIGRPHRGQATIAVSSETRAPPTTHPK